MRKHIQTALMLIAMLCSLTAFTALAQSSGTNSSAKMSDQEMMQKMDHMSTSEKAAMFDKMSHEDKMTAMKMAGHDMSKMSHEQKMQMMSNLTPEQKAGMFDKMPMDTKMATMKMGMKEQPGK
jgi:Spy/CpxP family protein refolding chaperone